MTIERPLDLLNDLKGKDVTVERKSDKVQISGKLICFDIHINLVIERNDEQEFIKGDTVDTVFAKK